MSGEELVRLLESGDYYGLMLRANRLWLERDHPEVKWACVVGEVGGGVPALRITIPGASSPSPTPDAPLLRPA